MRLVSNAMATFSAKYYRTLLANYSGANGKAPVALGHSRRSFARWQTALVLET